MNFLYLLFTLCIQPSQSSPLAINFVDPEIHVFSSEKPISFDIRLTNTFDRNFLLYNFLSEPEQAFIDESFYCNEELAARTIIIIYDAEMNPVYAHPKIPDDIKYKPITVDDLRTVIETEKKKFRSALQPIGAKSTVTVSIKASLKEFPLTSGLYYVKVIYSSGVYNLNMINERDVLEDENKFNAKMFQGCINSDTVRLIVE